MYYYAFIHFTDVCLYMHVCKCIQIYIGKLGTEGNKCNKGNSGLGYQSVSQILLFIPCFV